MTCVCPVCAVGTAGYPDVETAVGDGSFVDPAEPETAVEVDCGGRLAGIEAVVCAETDATGPGTRTVGFGIPDVVPCSRVALPKYVQLVIEYHERGLVSAGCPCETREVVLEVFRRSVGIGRSTDGESEITIATCNSPTDPKSSVARIRWDMEENTSRH